jgi:hypothetical protein
MKLKAIGANWKASDFLLWILAISGVVAFYSWIYLSLV